MKGITVLIPSCLLLKADPGIGSQYGFDVAQVQGRGRVLDCLPSHPGPASDLVDDGP